MPPIQMSVLDLMSVSSKSQVPWHHLDYSQISTDQHDKEYRGTAPTLKVIWVLALPLSSCDPSARPFSAGWSFLIYKRKEGPHFPPRSSSLWFCKTPYATSVKESKSTGFFYKVSAARAFNALAIWIITRADPSFQARSGKGSVTNSSNWRNPGWSYHHQTGNQEQPYFCHRDGPEREPVWNRLGWSFTLGPLFLGVLSFLSR